MAIYRIEHSANGHGPFANADISVYRKHAIIDGHPSCLHPTPDTEFYCIQDKMVSSLIKAIKNSIWYGYRSIHKTPLDNPPIRI